MKINPINVITLLQATFQVMQIPETSVNRYEVELAENINNILLSSTNEANAVEVINEEILDFEEELKDYEVNAIKDHIC